MPKCHYCSEELEKAEYLDTEMGFGSAAICMNEDCQVNKIVNLYFKPWSLTKEEIAERLADIDVTWKWHGKFFFYVTPQDHYEIRSRIEGLCRENGSILYDSEIDFVMSNPEEILRQISQVRGEEVPINA
jgi:hypothetical protein